MQITVVIAVAFSLTGITLAKSVGTCDSTWYYLEKSYCDTVFVSDMANSTQPIVDCPDLYIEARDCFEEKVLQKCFADEDDERHAKTKSFLDKEFGSEDHFCKEGLLFSMETIMTEVNISKCADGELTDYAVCEEPFRKAFQEEFEEKGADLEKLSKLYGEADLCQSKIATACNIPETSATFHFFDSDEFNPYDPKVRKELNDAVNKLENGESVTSNTPTIVLAVVLVLVILAAVAGIWYYLRRRDIAREEIRREKRESQKKPGQTSGGATELQPLSSNPEGEGTSDKICPA